MSKERIYWLAWSQMSGVGTVLMRRLEEHFNSLENAWQANARDLVQVKGLGKQLVERITSERASIQPEEFIVLHTKKNPNFWTPADPEYPSLLLEIPSYPPVLYYRGQIDQNENQGTKPIVAIVGTRSPSEYGKRWTNKISSLLAENGFTIISGLATGIDTESHRACLEAGGRTLAVFGTGIDVVYPKENKSLAEKILDQGMILSEYPAGTKPDKIHFPQRNRIVAGLSRATLVLEAPLKSGALITARCANDFGRDVYVLPGRLEDERSIGCLSLIDQGAHVIISENDLLQKLGAIPPLENTKQLSLFTEQLAPKLEPRLEQVFRALGPEPTPFDVIVQNSGVDAAIASGNLLELELMGLVSQLPGMRYQKS